MLILNAFLAQLVQVTIAISIIGILHRLFAERFPHVLSALWVVVLIKCLTPPVLMSPSGIFCWSQPPASIVVTSTKGQVEGKTKPAPRRIIEVDAGDRLYAEQSPEAIAEAWHGSASNVIAQESSKRGFPEQDRIKTPHEQQGVAPIWNPSPWDWLGSCLVFIWAFGAFSRFGLQLLRLRRLSNKVLSNRVPTRSEWQTDFDNLCDRLKLRRRPELVIITQSIGPLVLGTWRTKIVVPLDLLKSSENEFRQTIFGHELLHVRRGDLWPCRLQFLAEAIWWFHPMVHWAARKLVESIETCCDRSVVAELGIPPRRYAHHLLSIVENRSHLRSLKFLPGVRAWEITTLRLERVMRLRQGCHKLSPWTYWTAAIVAMGLLLPGAPLLKGKELASEFVTAKGNHRPNEKNFKENPNKASQDSEAVQPKRQAAPSPTQDSVDTQDRLFRNNIEPAVEHEFDLSQTIDAMVAKANVPDRSQAIQHLEEFAWSLVDSEAQVTRSGEELHLKCSNPVAQRFAQELTAIRQFGTQTFCLDVRFISAFENKLAKISDDWAILRYHAPGEVSENLALVGQQALDTQSERPRVQGATVRRVVDETTVLRYQVIQPGEVEEFLRKFTSNDFQMIRYPTRLVRNGQKDAIIDISQSAFLVGIDPQTENDQNNSDEEALYRRNLVRLIDEGIVLWFRPALIDEKTIWLDGNFSIAEMIEVTEHQLDTQNDAESSATKEPLNLPKIARTMIQTSTKLPLGGALVITGMDREIKDGKREELMIFVRCSEYKPLSARHGKPAEPTTIR